MDEARRILRYVLPGLVYGVVAGLLVWVVLPGTVLELVAKASGESGLAVALGGLLASGGLGYVFASAHHFIHWHFPADRNVIDHSESIRRLIAEGLIQTRTVDRQTALEATLELWYLRLGGKSPIAGADPKIAALGDLAHSAGAARVAAFAALVTTICVCALEGRLVLEAEPIVRFGAMLTLGVLCVWLFDDSYRRTGKLAQTLYDGVLSATLRREREEHNKRMQRTRDG